MQNTGIDLSKILGETKILGEQWVAITDEIIGVSQLLGALVRVSPQSLRWGQSMATSRACFNVQ